MGDLIEPKFPLVPREEAKDDKRPLARKSAPGDSVGESTLAPLVPFNFPEEEESLRDMMLGRKGGGVLKVIEDCAERLEVTENRRGRAGCRLSDGRGC